MNFVVSQQGLEGTTEIIASGASIGAPIALAAAGLTSAIPFVGPAIAGVTLLVGMFTQRGKQKTATTAIVNEAEPLLKQNLEAWNQSSKTLAEQKQALANFDAVWGQVVNTCKNPSYGEPGKWCINDRSRGGKWDWFSYYYDPIALDPNVQAASFSSQTFGGGNVGGVNWIVVGGLGIIALLALKGN